MIDNSIIDDGNGGDQNCSDILSVSVVLQFYLRFGIFRKHQS